MMGGVGGFLGTPEGAPRLMGAVMVNNNDNDFLNITFYMTLGGEGDGGDNEP